jgi:hypothetical protein
VTFAVSPRPKPVVDPGYGQQPKPVQQQQGGQRQTIGVGRVQRGFGLKPIGPGGSRRIIDNQARLRIGQPVRGAKPGETDPRTIPTRKTVRKASSRRSTRSSARR